MAPDVEVSVCQWSSRTASFRRIASDGAELWVLYGRKARGTNAGCDPLEFVPIFNQNYKMSPLSKFRLFSKRSGDQDAPAAATSDIEISEHNKNGEIEAQPDDIADLKAQQPDEDAQSGVRVIEGITLTWSKWSLIWIFCKYVRKLNVALMELGYSL